MKKLLVAPLAAMVLLALASAVTPSDAGAYPCYRYLFTWEHGCTFQPSNECLGDCPIHVE